MGPQQNWTILRGYFYTFKFFFLKVKVENGGYFLGLLNFKYFRVLEIPDIFFFFLVNGRCWA